ncbi:MAG TPA: hypothetical protein VFC09_01425 [Candidatus Dormibacteraeota bacterium]|nr:hypothetical protein [Candidatus Dormibacteraeota bacterium]
MDSRIREQVTRRISSYDGRVASLGHLVADLDAIWRAETWDEERRKRLRAEWEKLEEIYATATERRPREMTAVDVERVIGVLSKVMDLLPPGAAAHE